MAHFEVVADHGSGDLSHQKTIDAVCMRLSAGIEALSGLSDADRAALFGDVWTQMMGIVLLIRARRGRSTPEHQFRPDRRPLTPVPRGRPVVLGRSVAPGTAPDRPAAAPRRL